MVEILVPITMFVAIFGIVYISLTTRNRERLAMIEKGIDPSQFKREGNPHWVLKIGLLCVGVAVGIIMGNVLETAQVMTGDVAYPGMIFLFAGMSLILAYFIEKKMKEKEKDSN